MGAPRFLLFLAAAALLLVVALAGFNLAVDPYLLFGMGRTPGFNAVKPAVGTHEYLIKTYQASRVQARTVILGSSRPDIGLDPQSSAWPAAYRPVYNLSRVSSDVDTDLLFLRHLMATNGQKVRTRTVVVSVDFVSYLVVPRAASKPGADTELSEAESRLAVLRDGTPNPGRRLQVLRDQVLSLLSLDAVLDSVRTVIASQSPPRSDVRDDGKLSEGFMRAWAQDGGMALMFRQKFANTVARYASPLRVLAGTSGGDGLADIQAMADFAKAEDLTLVLVIQPVHVSWLEMLDFLGYWGAYEQWKRELTRRVAALNSTGADVSLWDFGGYDRYSTERIPDAGDRATPMQWYWDPVHYSVRLGELILRRVLGTGDNDEFGIPLTPDNVDHRLAEVRAARERYRLTHPDQVTRFKSLYCEHTNCGTLPY